MLSSNLFRISLFGLPPDIEYGSTSLTTTDPAAITAPVPILTPERIIVLPPIQTSCPIFISPFDWLKSFIACAFLNGVSNWDAGNGEVVIQSYLWFPPI